MRLDLGMPLSCCETLLSHTHDDTPPRPCAAAPPPYGVLPRTSQRREQQVAIRQREAARELALVVVERLSCRSCTICPIDAWFGAKLIVVDMCVVCRCRIIAGYRPSRKNNPTTGARLTPSWLLTRSSRA